MLKKGLLVLEMSKLYLKMNDLEKARSYREMAHDVMSQLNEKNRRNLVEDLKNLDALIKHMGGIEAIDPQGEGTDNYLAAFMMFIIKGKHETFII